MDKISSLCGSKDGFFGSDHVETGRPQNDNSTRRILTHLQIQSQACATDRKQRSFKMIFVYDVRVLGDVRFRVLQSSVFGVFHVNQTH